MEQATANYQENCTKNLENTKQPETENKQQGTVMYHRFMIKPGQKVNLLADAFLGKILKFAIQRIDIIDPYLFQNRRNVSALKKFLAQLRTDEDHPSDIIIKTGALKPLNNFHGDYASREAQIQAKQHIIQTFSNRMNVHIDVAKKELLDHDRVILVQIRDNSLYRHFFIWLGHGLYGLMENSRSKRSNVIWLEVTEQEYHKMRFEFQLTPYKIAGGYK